MPKNKISILVIGILMLLLICVRLFENELFYDPFLLFYKTNYEISSFPEVDDLKLFFGLFFRYGLNSLLSICIIYIIFKDLEAIKFVSILYAVFFIVFIAMFFMLLKVIENPNKMLLFYVRRFLIQPIFLLLFIPAFYFQKITTKN
jgi:exosortase F-associated protein